MRENPRYAIDQIFNKILEKNFPKLRKDTYIEIQGTHGTQLSRWEKTPYAISQ